MISKNPNNRSRYINFFLLLFVSLFLVVILTFQYIGSQEKSLSNKIYPNVYIDGKEVGNKTKDELNVIYKKKTTSLQNFQVNVLYDSVQIATFSAEKLNVHSNGPEIVDRAYLVGRSSHGPSRVYQKLTTLFGIRKYTFSSEIVYDKGTINDFISTIEDQYNKPAKNALFSFEDGKVVNFREDEKGLKIDTEKFKRDLDKAVKALNKKTENQTIILTSHLIEPEVSLKDSNNLGIEEEIAEGKSDYSHSIPERVHNLTLAASKFHGILIPKDKVFSFDDIIGDISSQSGYKPAYVIKNGKTVLGDGGGVCQVSTTIFRTALNAGLPIVERTAHAYRVLYYENDSKPGFDATIFSPTVDLKFKNNTPSAILIQIEQDKDNNILTMKFYGKKDGRVSEITDYKLYDEEPPPPPLYQDDPTLKRGITKQIDFPAWGAKASFQYKVTKDKEILFEKKFISYFKPWQAVYLVGVQD